MTKSIQEGFLFILARFPLRDVIIKTNNLINLGDLKCWFFVFFFKLDLPWAD